MLRFLLVALLTLALPLSASADSLVAAARKERARQAKLRSKDKGQVLNNRNLGGRGGTLNQAPVTRTKAPTASATQAQDAKAAALDEWKTRLGKARQAIEDAERDLSLARTKTTIVLTDQIYADGTQFNRRAEQETALKARGDAEKALAAAKTDYRKLQEEARRAGVPASIRR